MMDINPAYWRHPGTAINFQLEINFYNRRKSIMKQTLMIPQTFLGVGYTKDRAGLPLEAVRVPLPRPEADQVLIRVAASSLNPLEYKLAELNFLGRRPPSSLASTWPASWWPLAALCAA
jgi:hypothetical protein